MWRDLTQSWIRLVFPPGCVLCHADFTLEPGAELCSATGAAQLPADAHAGGGQPVPAGELLLCKACCEQLVGQHTHQCHRCGANRLQVPFGPPGSVGCSICQKSRWRFGRVLALGNYGGKLREAVFELKREGRDEVALHVGRFLARHGNASQLFFAEADGLVPIPLQWRRKLLPGTNQAELLADGISMETGLPVFRKHLSYTRATEKQGLLSKTSRKSNLHGAMACRRVRQLAGLRLVIVDDVLTSGATADEAARVLLDAGAAEVRVAVVARGIGSA